MNRKDRSIANTIRVLGQTVQEICVPRMIDEASDHPLSRNQFLTLNLLSKRDGFSVGEIARILSITPPAATKIVFRLEQLDLAERRSRPGDRRVVDITLRDEGRAFLKRFDKCLRIRQSHILAQFTTEEKTQLLELVRRYVRAALAEETDTEVICLQCFNRVGEDCVLEDRDDRCLRKLRT